MFNNFNAQRTVMIFSALLLFACAGTPKEIPLTPLTEEKELDFTNLVWSDEFDGEGLNLENWEYMIGDGTTYGLPSGWGNNEAQYYTDDPKNIRIEDGELVITAINESYQGKNFSSARIRSNEKEDVLFGRIEARIKLPGGNGIWPAFWMLPTDWVYGGWAASGELDIIELFGSLPHTAVGTIHQGGTWPNNSYRSGRHRVDPETPFSDDYHVYAVEWEPDVIRWYVDDVMYTEAPSDEWFVLNEEGDDVLENVRAPFDQRFHMLLNLAINGSEYKEVDETTPLPAVMRVDYVRIYR
ncbi:MAG: glycoside hydrolase family 16 protein [Spirochaetaceae bacterium]|jgi:beta-glucanase (GH16 family)|nr:glycoside hydrolase family 16 protein [Spirochaetaceae bacterium]